MNLCYYGNPILRKKAKEVEEITDEIRALIEGMTKIMLDTNGIGIAAPQVGHSLRLFVSIVEGEDAEGKLIICDPYVFINPVLSNPGTTQSEMDEGCLSIPELFIPVIRPLSVDVEALDIEGKPFSKKCHGFLARHVMHENDHLNGVLTIDRLKGKRRTQIEPDLRRIKQKYKNA